MAQNQGMLYLVNFFYKLNYSWNIFWTSCTRERWSCRSQRHSFQTLEKSEASTSLG